MTLNVEEILIWLSGNLGADPCARSGFCTKQGDTPLRRSTDARCPDALSVTPASFRHSARLANILICR